MGFEPTSSPSQGDVLNQLDDLQHIKQKTRTLFQGFGFYILIYLYLITQ